VPRAKSSPRKRPKTPPRRPANAAKRKPVARAVAATRDPIQEALARIKFDRQGLVAAVAQQFDTGEVLMLAWMTRAAVEESLRSGKVTYWSRSRGKLWRKGESSGQEQRLVELRVDCDGDTLLVLVDQVGVACHTGHRACFFTALRGGKLEEILPVTVDPKELYGER
jgi:phosphoribosyl-AMP cyclohydrolase